MRRELLLLAAAGTALPLAAQGPPAPARPRPYPLFESRPFSRAVEQETRTRTGRPGPKYWQQRVDYQIRNTLRELQQKGSRQIAVIDTKVEVAVPEMEVPVPKPAAEGAVPMPQSISMDNFSQSVTSTQFFDVARGELRMGDFITRLGMQMEMEMGRKKQKMKKLLLLELQIFTLRLMVNGFT